MGTQTEPKFTLAVDLATTSWGSSLLTDEIGSSAKVDVAANPFDDFILGGLLESGGSPAAGGTMNAYVTSRYDEAVSSAYGGALDGNITGVDEELTEDTEVQLAGLKLVASRLAISSLGSHFGGEGIARFFGGVPPENWLSILHNNTSVTMTAGSLATYIGVHWDVP